MKIPPNISPQVVILRNKHASQQKIVNKLIQFLVTMVQPSAAHARHMSHAGAVSPAAAVAASIKRKFAGPLAIEDENSGASGAKEPRRGGGGSAVTVRE